jgi:hypothetical protein
VSDEISRGRRRILAMSLVMIPAAGPSMTNSARAQDGNPLSTLRLPVEGQLPSLDKFIEIAASYVAVGRMEPEAVTGSSEAWRGVSPTRAASLLALYSY